VTHEPPPTYGVWGKVQAIHAVVEHEVHPAIDEQRRQLLAFMRNPALHVWHFVRSVERGVVQSAAGVTQDNPPIWTTWGEVHAVQIPAFVQAVHPAIFEQGWHNPRRT